MEMFAKGFVKMPQVHGAGSKRGTTLPSLAYLNPGKFCRKHKPASGS